MASTKRELLEDLRDELAELGFDASKLSDEEIITLLEKAGITIVSTELN
jgi:hypothetical protein